MLAREEKRRQERIMDTITFLAFGDFGQDTPILRDNIGRIHQFKKENIDAILSLGDNFYNYGVRSITDPKWKEWHTSFRPWCPFYAILGNHDYLDNIDAQIQFPHRYWRMPHRYYDKRFGGNLVHVFFLDTFTMCPDQSRGYSLAMGMWDYDDFYSVKDMEQYEWLDQQLSNSNCLWKIVVGHYPVFSNGQHGDSPELVHDLLPILKRHNVDFYLCGHDHDMEFIHKHDIQFIVSGSASFSNPTNMDRDSVYASNPPIHGIASLQFTNQFCRFGFITNHGQPTWYSVPNRKNILYTR